MTRKIFTFVLPIAGCALLIAAQGAVAAGPAKEGNAENLSCYAGPVHAITEVKGVVGISYDVVGTTTTSKEDDIAYRSSLRCVGSATIIGGETTDNGSCVQTDPEGDRIFLVYSARGKDPGTWKAVAGTGKFEGIEASGTWAHVIVPGKPARADYWQACDRETGHWKLK